MIMADISSNEDAALRYVLGEFNAGERREFESHLAASAELRALVNELETGVVAVAAAAPRRRPPAAVWQRIEKAVAKKARPTPAFPFFWFGWLRSGWAAALACLIGWLFYALSTNRHLAPVAEKSEIPQHAITVASSPAPAAKPVVSGATNVAFELSPSRTQEIMELRGKIARLETMTTQLSRSLAQQQALLGESNRVKFYHLVPASTAGGNASPAPLSPGLQRAVLTALALKLGWLPTASQFGQQAGGNLPATSTTIAGVDFINLRPGNNQPLVQPQAQSPGQPSSSQPPADNNTAAQIQPPAQPQVDSPAQSPAASQTASTSQPAIPAYVSGDNLVVALDSTVVPMGSAVTLTASDANQNQTGGSFILGNNPAVVTIPFSESGSTPILTTGGDATSGLSYVILSFQTPAGQTSTMQFSASPTTTNP